eukprot:3391077-Alexandrium_andersonii.AAC.1
MARRTAPTLNILHCKAMPPDAFMIVGRTTCQSHGNLRALGLFTSIANATQKQTISPIKGLPNIREHGTGDGTKAGPLRHSWASLMA